MRIYEYDVSNCFVSKDDKNDDKQEKVSVKDVKVDSCSNSRDILAKLVEKECKSNWTSFEKLYAKGMDYFLVVFSRHVYMQLRDAATVYRLVFTCIYCTCSRKAAVCCLSIFHIIGPRSLSYHCVQH